MRKQDAMLKMWTMVEILTFWTGTHTYFLSARIVKRNFFKDAAIIKNHLRAAHTNSACTFRGMARLTRQASCAADQVIPFTAPPRVKVGSVSHKCQSISRAARG
jgi:hypothetical protein